MAKLPVLSEWPVVRQVRAGDAGGLGETAASDRTRALLPRTATADRVARSVCPMPSLPRIDPIGRTSGKESSHAAGPGP